MEKRKELDDFQRQTRNFFNLIRANHHLQNVQRGPEELPAPKFLEKVKKWLAQIVKPALPKDATAFVLNGNAENWLQTSLQTLAEHHSETILALKNTLTPLTEGTWVESWLKAKTWIKKAFPYVEESLFDSTMDDLNEWHTLHFQRTESTPPPPKRQRIHGYHPPPCTMDQPDPQGRPVISTNPNNPLLSPVFAPLSLSKLKATPATTERPPQHIPLLQFPTTTDNTQPENSMLLPSSAFDLPPSPPLDLYTYHVHRGDKHTNWTLQPTRKFLVLGDSNMARLPAILDEWVQVDCYPGANISHATHLLKNNTPTTGEVERVILSFGINDKQRGNPSLLGNSLKKLIQVSKATFPNARIHIPVINASEELSSIHRLNIGRLNDLIKQIPHHIPRLNGSQFHTAADNIHWSPQTAGKMWQHWRSFLE